MSIVSLFCERDDFFLMYEAHITAHCLPKKARSERRGRRRGLHASEGMALLVAFHESNYRTLKHFYEKPVCVYWHGDLRIGCVKDRRQLAFDDGLIDEAAVWSRVLTQTEIITAMKGNILSVSPRDKASTTWSDIKRWVVGK